MVQKREITPILKTISQHLQALPSIYLFGRKSTFTTHLTGLRDKLHDGLLSFSSFTKVSTKLA